MQVHLKSVTMVMLLPLIYVRRLFGLVLSNLALSNRGRRMILSVSLYAHLKRIDTDHLNDQVVTDTTTDINMLFRLVKSNERALLIPIVFHKGIWRRVKLPSEEELRTQPVGRNCRRILKEVPKWLRYDEKVMSDDIALIIRKYVGRDIVQ